MSTTFFKIGTAALENSGIYFGVNGLRKALAEVISRRMKDMGDLNPYDVERKGGPTAAGVRKILKGENDIMLDSLVAIAGALNTTAPELLIAATGMNEDESVVREFRAERITEKLAALPAELQTAIEAQVDALLRTVRTPEGMQRAVHHDEPRKPSGRAIGRKAS